MKKYSLFFLLMALQLSACTPGHTRNAVVPIETEPVRTPTQVLLQRWTIEPISGSTYLRPADGMLMLDVPAGKFNMGSDDLDSDEKPIHPVYLNEFWIDQTEVTNGMYAKCVAEAACQPPLNSGSSFRSSYYGDAQFAEYPVIFVSWYGAGSYCAWVGGRLPTEAEWEKAARGTDERTYPWGNASPSCSLANYQGCKIDTVPVGSYPAGASPYGVLDMAGNVWEFVSDWYGETYYNQSPASNPQGPESGDGGYVVLRGGSWVESKDFLRSAYRLDDGPSNMDVKFGFRCSSSLP